MSTLFIPLSLAALGIVLRGVGLRLPQRRAPRGRPAPGRGSCSASSSLLTPFFMGTVVGAIASGRVPVGNAEGDAVTSWLNPRLAAGRARCSSPPAPTSPRSSWSATRAAPATPTSSATSRARALGAAVVAGALALAGIFVLRADARYIYDGLTSEALPLVILSALCGRRRARAAAARRAPAAPAPLAVGAVVAVIWGWGVAQYPYLLPRR